MSLWIRTQLGYHFGNGLSPEQNIAVLHEEMLIAQQARDKLVNEYEAMINMKAREIIKLRSLHELEAIDG